jgi:colanic acid biosynthesis protein WcaH
LYSAFIKCLPILCVDIITVVEGGYLLVRRNEEPLKGEYWVPGGRLQQGENLKSAARRKLIEECGVEVAEERFSLFGVYEDVFDRSSFGRHIYHTISMVFKVEVKDLEGVLLDKSSSDWKVMELLPDRLVSRLEKVNE